MTWFRCGMKKGIDVSEYNSLIDRSVTSVKTSAVNVGVYAFRSCIHLASVILYDANIINDYSFAGCRDLTNIQAPMAEYINGNAFLSCITLEAVSFENVRSIGSNAFNGCTLLNSITLSRNLKCVLYNANAFSGTQFDTTGTGGTVYVPSDLVTEYQNDANWAALLALNANNRIEAITT